MLCFAFAGYEIEFKDVSGFEVQKKAKRGDWKKCNTSPIGPKATEAKVGGLPEGEEYEFRVVAVNAAGPGAPSKSTGLHKIRDPICKYEHFDTLIN